MLKLILLVIIIKVLMFDNSLATQPASTIGDNVQFTNAIVSLPLTFKLPSCRQSIDHGQLYDNKCHDKC